MDKERSPIVVANIKEYGLMEDVLGLLQSLKKREDLLRDKTIILCFPIVYLDAASAYVNSNFPKSAGFSFFIGAQDVSRFPRGSYTGENSAEMLKQFAKYVIVGHSERRANFGETDEIVIEKVKRAKEEELIPIFCASKVDQVSYLKEKVPDFEDIILLEDPTAISTGKPDDLGNKSQPLNSSEANNLAGEMKEVFPEADIIYGASVDKNNIMSFLKQKNFVGVIIGARSLNSEFFLGVLEKISQPT